MKDKTNIKQNNMIGIETFVANLANRINQPHYLEIELRKFADAVLKSDAARDYWFEKFKLETERWNATQSHHNSVGAVLTEIDKARFWTKVEVTDYCWNWKANKDSCDYGMFRANGLNDKASRWAYRIIKGEFPKELHALHKCDNPSCVNPDHLFTGTHQDNMLDKMRKGRGKVLGHASKYYGVSFRKDSNNWRASIWNKRTHVSIGSFKTEIEAAKAYDKYVTENNIELPLNTNKYAMD
jgi:hypothetical protein